MNEGITVSFLKELSTTWEVDSSLLKDDFDMSSVDSLAVVSCVALIDEYFHLEVTGRDISACGTLGDLLRMISEKKVN